jgi:hypothetical protein
MFGQSDLGEQAISKVAEVGIASQLDEVENLDVEIHTNPLDLIQGKLESVKISGEGMVMKQDLRMESLEVSTGSIAINPGSVIFGKIDLVQPTDAAAKITLTENDINRALNSDFLAEKLQNLEMQVNGNPIIVDIQKAEMHLPGENKLTLQADVLQKDTNETKHFAVTATPEVQASGQRIGLNILSTESDLSPELTTALCNKIMELLDLKNFDMPGMSLQLQHLEAQEGELKLSSNTTIEQFPSA